jgi:hypothetical protein
MTCAGDRSTTADVVTRPLRSCAAQVWTGAWMIPLFGEPEVDGKRDVGP